MAFASPCWVVGRWPQYRNQHFDHQDESPMNLTETETSRSQYDSVKMWFYFPTRMHGKDLDAMMRRHLEVSSSGSQVVESWEGFSHHPWGLGGDWRVVGWLDQARAHFRLGVMQLTAWYLGCVGCMRQKMRERSNYNCDYKYISMTSPNCWRRYNQYLMIWRNEIEGTLARPEWRGGGSDECLGWKPTLESAVAEAAATGAQDFRKGKLCFFFCGGTSSRRLVLHSLLLGGLGCYQVTLPKSTREDSQGGLSTFC